MLDTVGQRDAKLADLISQLQRWFSGLAGDRKTIGDSITGINNLTGATAGLLSQARPQLKQDVVDLTGLAQTLNAGGSTIDGVLQRFPTKIATLTRTATYGSVVQLLPLFVGRNGDAAGQRQGHSQPGVPVLEVQLMVATRCEARA